MNKTIANCVQTQQSTATQPLQKLSKKDLVEGPSSVNTHAPVKA